MARLIKADGSEIEVQPAQGKKFFFRELQKFVGGLITYVPHMPRNRAMVCNEEGLIHKLPLNRLASAIAGQPIVGDVVVGTPRELNG